MKTVGRLCQTPIGKRALVKAFHTRNGCDATARLSNALQSAAIFVVASFFQVNPLPASEIKPWEEFSGEKALAHVQRLVDLGPRPAGSEAIEKARIYVEDQLGRSGWQVTRQAFTDDTPRGKVHFVNLIAR